MTYKVSLNEVDKYLKVQYEEKNFISSGRKNPGDGGVILSKLDTKDKLQEVLEKDPFLLFYLLLQRIWNFWKSFIIHR